MRKIVLAGRRYLSWQFGHKTVIELLLENGSKTDTKDNQGHTPLSIAAMNGHEVVAQLLLEKGADVEDTNVRTPLFLAEENELEKGAEV